MSVLPHPNEDSSPSAFYQELLGQMQPKLFGYILSIVANPADAQDVLQESNRVITAKLGELRQSDRFTAWAYRIAYYQSLAFLKKSRRDRHQFGDDLLANIAAMTEEVAESTEKGLARLDRCLARLPDRSRFVVSDYYYADLSIVEIGRKRSIQPNHVAQILYRSRKALHACITQLEEQENE